jgi:hypothetical protein
LPHKVISHAALFESLRVTLARTIFLYALPGFALAIRLAPKTHPWRTTAESVRNSFRHTTRQSLVKRP